MKPQTAFTATVILALAIGWFTDHRFQRRQISATTAEMVQSMETAEAEEAARALKVTLLLQVGETNKAIYTLAHPIANYYQMYGTSKIQSSSRTRLLQSIEMLISTNTIASNAIRDWRDGK
jgi:hypothetical protein